MIYWWVVRPSSSTPNTAFHIKIAGLQNLSNTSKTHAKVDMNIQNKKSVIVTQILFLSNKLNKYKEKYA